MRPYLLYVASLAAAIVAGGFCVAQAHAHADGITTDDSPIPPPPAPLAPKSRTATAEDLKTALAPKLAPEAVRKQMLDALFDRLRNAEIGRAHV